MHKMRKMRTNLKNKLFSNKTCERLVESDLSKPIDSTYRNWLLLIFSFGSIYSQKFELCKFGVGERVNLERITTLQLPS